MRTVVMGILVVSALALAACTSGETEAFDGTEPFDDAESFDDTTEVDDTAQVEQPEDNIDLTLTRDDVDCSPEAVGGDGTDFSTVHVVVDGILGTTCLGSEDATLYAAWEALATIAPTTARSDLALFGGFSGGDDGEEVTLAFVNALDDDGTVFQMSINLASFEDDENEAYLTVAHEFSHVFTLGSTQIDRVALAEECETFDNGEGCFYNDALMAQWVELFWTDQMLSDFDSTQEATSEIGAPRCELNPEFLGPYAASSPDEDFAETFAAFVFGVEVDPALDPKVEWMAAQPGLVEFRDRAEAAGLTPLDNGFELCG